MLRWVRGIRFVLLSAFVALGPARAAGAAEFAPPATEGPDEGGWESYTEPFVIDAGSAAELRPGHDSPEAALVHFYASKVRGDEAYKEVMPPEKYRSAYYERALDRMKAWTFKEVHLLARRRADEDKVWIRISFVIQVEGEEDGGEDEAELSLFEGKWYVAKPPT